MIVGVDGGSLSVSDDRLKVGVHRVSFELLRELSILDRKSQYRLYGFNENIKRNEKLFEKNIELKVLKPSQAWSTIRLPLELTFHPIDIFLGISQKIVMPFYFSKKQKNVGFIYDLGFLYSPEVYADTHAQLVAQTLELVKQSQHIITISNSTKKDILQAYDFDQEKISVCYPGVTDVFSSVGEKFNHSREYFLFVGSLNKAKDIPRLLRCFSIFLSQQKKAYDLLLVGGDYWPDSTIDSDIEKLKITKRVRKLGHIPDANLPALYRGATAFVTCGKREGFCLPVAESMRCGTPIVAFDRGSLKEVIGDGGIVVRDDDNDFITALTTLLDRKVRSKYSLAAQLEAKKYTWQTMAIKVRDILYTI